jgi:hypothetical protein
MAGLFLIYQITGGRLRVHGLYPTRHSAERGWIAVRRDWPSKWPYRIADITGIGALEPRLRWHGLSG